jgi:4-diphosphocytidyl-2-C-methyl-D-erythritol kinase
MRGRGERVELLPDTAAARIRSRRLLLFKPSFGINTAWAYREMAALAPAAYLPGSDAESRLATWINSAAGLEELVFNNMERVAFAKYVALPTLLAKLRKSFGLTVGMSGSGSACYALLVESSPGAEIRACIQDALGAQVFVAETQIR